MLVVLAAVTVLLFVVVSPFLEYVLFAIVLGYVLYPLHSRLSSYTGEFVSPIVLILGSILVVVFPLAYVVTRFVRDLQAVARGETDVRTDAIEARIADLTGIEIGFIEALEALGELLVDALFGGAPALFSTLLDLMLGAALVLFLVFYLLRDGSAFVTWVQSIVPLPPRVFDRLIDQIDRTTWGAVIGHGFSAFVQTIVAGVGLYLAGIPNVFFWTFVMFVLAFLPLIGVFLVWGPAAAYLYLVGSTVEGTLLAIYGATIVSMIDYYVRPLVIDQQARLNPAVLLIGVFGGLYTMGFVGLFVGPITIGVFVATVRTIREDYDDI